MVGEYGPGSFYGKTQGYKIRLRLILNIFLVLGFYFEYLFCHPSTILIYKSKAIICHYFSIFLCMLLILSGDIETNPGPHLDSGNVNIDGISIVHLNIRSIRNKMDFISDFLSDFDIMCFTETHLDADISDSALTIDTRNSKMYRHDFNSHSGGLLVYISNSFYSRRRHDLENCSVHSIWVEVKYRAKAFLLCTVYRSQNAPTAFWDHFNTSVERAYESNESVIIVGDLNQNPQKPNENKLTNIMSLNNLTNVIRKPTRITRNSSTLLDPIIVSDQINVIQADTLDVDSSLSDHKATTVLLKFVSYHLQALKGKFGTTTALTFLD